MKKVAIQGYEGSFHDEASHQYFKKEDLAIQPCDTFQELADKVNQGSAEIGVMAIENSIAGTILQNYRILRESKLAIHGEVYLRIEHNLLAKKGSQKSNIEQVASHPMAINQCLEFLKTLPKAKIISSTDTALSAQDVALGNQHSSACIASAKAAEVYDLEILDAGIETNKQNYTRFFIVSNRKADQIKGNKASIYIKITDRRGKLLEVLQIIDDHQINLSKLQSFPVMGALRAYYFHMDLEFDEVQQFTNAFNKIDSNTQEAHVLGVYERADFKIKNQTL